MVLRIGSDLTGGRAQAIGFYSQYHLPYCNGGEDHAECAEAVRNAAARDIQRRVTLIIERLHEWPDVSGAKPLRGSLAGHYRIRTGDYRVQFHVEGVDVVIEKVGNRDRFYDE